MYVYCMFLRIITEHLKFKKMFEKHFDFSHFHVFFLYKTEQSIECIVYIASFVRSSFWKINNSIV